MITCATCQHSHEIIESEELERLVCRRFPPSPVSLITTDSPKGNISPSGVQYTPVIRTDIFAIHPTVNPESTCGEWSEAKT